MCNSIGLLYGRPLWRFVERILRYEYAAWACHIASGLLYTLPHSTTRARTCCLNIKALPYVTLLGLFFGSSMVGSRFGVGQFEPITYIGVRMIISSLMALSVYRIALGEGAFRATVSCGSAPGYLAFSERQYR